MRPSHSKHLPNEIPVYTAQAAYSSTNVRELMAYRNEFMSWLLMFELKSAE